MKNVKLSVIIGLIFTLTIGITVYATYDRLESSRAKDQLNYSVLQDTQFQLKQLENEVSEMKSLERKDLKTYCLGVQSTAIIALDQDNPATPEQKEKWEKLKARSCENYYTDTLAKVYSAPSDLYYVFMKSDGVYETQNVRQHMARSGYVAMDIATGGRKLNVRAPSFMPDKDTDLEMEYTVKIVKNYDTMGLTVELYFEYEGVKYNWAIGHMNTLAEGIEDGAIVKTGDVLGLNGGVPSELKFNEKSTGAHSHLELRKEGSPIAFPEWKYTQHHGEDGKIEPTAEAAVLNNKEDLGSGWRISTYYSVEKGQKKYFNGGYEGDKAMNCGPGDCLTTASGYVLKKEDSMKIVACPKNYEHGTIMEIEGFGQVRCEDVGGAINGKHLDLWVGIGDEGYANVGQGSSKNAHVYLIK